MLSLAGTTESSMPASGAVLLPISAYADVTRAFPLCAIIGSRPLAIPLPRSRFIAQARPARAARYRIIR